MAQRLLKSKTRGNNANTVYSPHLPSWTAQVDEDRSLRCIQRSSWQPGVIGGLLPTLTIWSFQNHVESDGNPILPVPRGPRCSSSATQAPMAPEAPGCLRCCLDPKTDALGLLCYFASAKWWVCLRKVDWILVIFWVLFKSEELVFCLCFFFSFF